MEGGEDGEEEFEVEDILRYRRNEDGAEYFLVKWVGYSEADATWEPFAHMNDNCRELVAKARALFAWRRPPAGSGDLPAAGEIAVSSSQMEVATSSAPPPVATGTSSGPALPAAEEPSASLVIEEDDQAGVLAGPLGALVGQEDEEEEEEEGDAEEHCAESPPAESPAAGSPFGEHQPAFSPAASPGFPALGEEIIVEDLDSPPPADEPQQEPPPPPALLPAGKRPADLSAAAAPSQKGGSGFSGAPSDPRMMKRPRLMSSEATGSTASHWESSSQQGAAASAAAATVSMLTSGALPKPSSAAAAVPAATLPPPERPKPPSREMKCICGASEQIPAGSRSTGLIVCRVCNCSLHPACVETAVGGPVPSNFVCPPCRLERVDEFHPVVGTGLLKHSYASSSSTFSLTFTAQAAQWRKQMWAVHLRGVHVAGGDLSGPAWPHKVQGKLNGRQCVAIDPPKHLHVRREQCYNLTPLLKPGSNTLELRFYPKPDRERDAPEENYCIGVVLTRPRSVASIIARIRTRSQETVSTGRARVERLLAQVARAEAGQEDECRVTGNFGRTLKPLCPVSFCPIEEAAIGRECQHVQVFDLQAYIAVNQRMRSLDKRWTCPVCGSALRPDDVVLHPFAQGILDTVRGDEELVEAIVFNEDCSWSTVSAVKDEKRAGEGDEEAAGADIVDLSDED
eukprot:TRINITY_DN74533_c0_g1_i1.p1 TRINITY_DN74533_c0_g1~~TRINITY_DN74533_c0_g1_i1.p1  ORF type:complete len:683 (+),score=135.44 TRINITY_DN74533_c0_g1_i1:63-2111(+)